MRSPTSTASTSPSAASAATAPIRRRPRTRSSSPSRIVTTLQTLVSRENDPLNPAVVTVGSFQAGAKHNIISDEAKLQLTVRSYKPEVRKLLLDGITRIARGEAIAAGMPEDRMPVVTVREGEYTPGDLQHRRASRTRAWRCSPQHFGAQRVERNSAASWAARTSAASGSPTSRSRA